MRKAKQNNQGFTLIEMLLYMGLSAIILTSLTEVFVLIGRLRLESQSFSASEQDGIYLLSRFAYDLGRSSSISIPSLGGQGVVLQTNKVRYSLDSQNRLQITDSLGTDIINNYDVSISNLTFYHLNGGIRDLVRISFSLNGHPFITTVGPR